MSLSGYLHFWAVAFIAVTGYLAFFQPEVRVYSSPLDSSPRTQRVSRAVKLTSGRGRMR